MGYHLSPLFGKRRQRQLILLLEQVDPPPLHVIVGSSGTLGRYFGSVTLLRASATILDVRLAISESPSFAPYVRYCCCREVDSHDRAQLRRESLFLPGTMIR